MIRSAGTPSPGARSAAGALFGRSDGGLRRVDRSRPVKRARRSALAGSVLPLALLAGCTAEATPAPEPAPALASAFAECTALRAAPSSAAPGSTVPPSTGPASTGPASTGPASTGPAPAAVGEAAELPDLELPCFTGGQPFRLTDLRGPAVVNLWASWCGPCRDELPVMQRLADRTDGRLHVLGVDVGDGREAAISFAAGKQVTMPTLYDRERRLLTALGRVTLPVTIFVDAAGRDYVHAEPLDAAELAELVREHTGVTVTP